MKKILLKKNVEKLISTQNERKCLKRRSYNFKNIIVKHKHGVKDE